jgi:hypothetical protein
MNTSRRALSGVGAFQELKQHICKEPVLMQPDQTKPFEVEVNASNYAIGAVLMQKDDNGKMHLVAFFSKTMNKAQRNYDVYNQELMGVVEMCQHWRQYLHQAQHKFQNSYRSCQFTVLEEPRRT